LTIFSLTLSLSAGILVGGRASAHTDKNESKLANSTQPEAAVYPALSIYATDLTTEAEASRLQSARGRAAEIKRAIEILGQQDRKNPVLIAESGPVTAELSQGITATIATGDVMNSFQGDSLISLTLAAVGRSLIN